MQTISSLFAGVALAALATPAAFAQAAPESAPETPIAAPADVQTDPEPETSADIVVLGFGQSR
jgi:iron complex outermembrane receptor protein